MPATVLRHLGSQFGRPVPDLATLRALSLPYKSAFLRFWANNLEGKPTHYGSYSSSNQRLMTAGYSSIPLQRGASRILPHWYGACRRPVHQQLIEKLRATLEETVKGTTAGPGPELPDCMALNLIVAALTKH